MTREKKAKPPKKDRYKAYLEKDVTVYLKNKTALSGTLVEYDDEELVLKDTSGRRTTVSRSSVTTITGVV